MDKKPVMHFVMLWSIFVFLLFLAVVYFPGLSSVLILIAALLALPVGKLQSLYLKLLRRRWVQILLILLLLLVAMVYRPAPERPEGVELFYSSAAQLPAGLIFR